MLHHVSKFDCFHLFFFWQNHSQLLVSFFLFRISFDEIEYFLRSFYLTEISQLQIILFLIFFELLPLQLFANLYQKWISQHQIRILWLSHLTFLAFELHFFDYLPKYFYEFPSLVIFNLGLTQINFLDHLQLIFSITPKAIISNSSVNLHIHWYHSIF